MDEIVFQLSVVKDRLIVQGTDNRISLIIHNSDEHYLVSCGVRLQILTKVVQLQAELKKLNDFNKATGLCPGHVKTDEKLKRISDSCISCMYLGGDCCGTLYWTDDGKIKCNECGREFNLSLK